MKSTLRLALAAALAIVAGRALAAPPPSTTGTFQVTASTATACAFTTTNPIAFGTYDPTAAGPLNGSTGATGYSFKCSKGTGYTVTINHGQNDGAGAVAGQPAMTATPAGEFLSYNLCADTSCTTKYTNGATIFSGSATSNGQINAPTIFGQIPAGQDVSANQAFADTVTLTVNY